MYYFYVIAVVDVRRNGNYVAQQYLVKDIHLRTSIQKQFNDIEMTFISRLVQRGRPTLNHKYIIQAQM